VNHKSAQRYIADYLDGTLSSRRRARLDQHLERCDECQNEVHELRLTISLLRGLADPEPPENLAESVLQRIAAGEADASWTKRADQWLGSLWEAVSAPQYALPAAAVLALVAVLGIGPGPGFRLPTSPGFYQETPVAVQEGSDRSPAPHSPRLAPLSEPGLVASRLVPSVSRSLPFQRGRLTLSPTGRGTRPQNGSLSQAAYAEPARESRVLRSADDWIEVLIKRPSEFAAEHARLSEVERELWITYVARRAVETNRFDQLLDALQVSPEPVSVALAQDFALLEGRR